MADADRFSFTRKHWRKAKPRVWLVWSRRDITTTLSPRAGSGSSDRAGSLHGKSELLISRWAVIASKIGANAPGLTAAALSLMNRILPEEELDAGDSQIEGRDVRGSAALLPNVLGRSAELTWNE
jgi:hypothetical protein